MLLLYFLIKSKYIQIVNFEFLLSVENINDTDNYSNLLSSEASFFKDVAIRDIVIMTRAPITTRTTIHFLSAMLLLPVKIKSDYLTLCQQHQPSIA